MLYPLSYGGGCRGPRRTCRGTSRDVTRAVPAPVPAPVLRIAGVGSRSLPAAASRKVLLVARILVVDDDAVIRELLRMNFVLEGFEVVEASDGASAIASVRTATVDAVVLDVMMPAPNGFEVCEQLRSESATATLPIVLLTAMASSGDRTRGEAVGADAFVTKPFDPLGLVELIRGLLAGQRP